MIFEKYIMPGLMLSSFRDVTPELLGKRGVKHLLCDIDNTLVTYDDAEPTREVLEWFEKMRESGVRVSFVSNNKAERVDKFNEKLGYIAYSKAGKPKTKFLIKAMEDAGTTTADTALLGDQLLTDAAAAGRAGLFSYIVPPIKDKKTLFFRAKRLIEKPYVKKYKKIYGNGEII